MPEIKLELSLSRSSGVLAGVVASLAQAGIALKSQKIQRANEGRGGWLTILGEGEPPAPPVLADKLNNTRGVDRLMRMVVDGETLLAEGKPLADQIQAGDLAELSAGSKSGTDVPQAAAQDAYIRDPEPAAEPRVDIPRQVPAIEDSPILSDPEWEEEPRPRPATRITNSSTPARDELPPLLVEDEAAEAEAETRSTRSLPAAEPDHLAEEALAAALEPSPTGNDKSDEEPVAAPGTEIADSREENSEPAFAAEPSAEDDLAEALDQEREQEKPAADATNEGTGDEKDPDRVKAALRRRRRRRK